MSKFLYTLTVCLLLLLTPMSYAQQVLGESGNTKQTAQTSESGSLVAEPLLADPLVKGQPPEVGKHVMANTDAGSMILSLLMVLALIIISALVLKRFNFTQQNSSQIKVIASLSLGVKERLVVAQVGDQQLVLGVTPQNITLIKSLEEPIASNQPEKASVLSGKVLDFLQKTNFNTKNK